MAPAAVMPLVEELAAAPSAWEAACRFAGQPFFLFLDSAAADSPWSRYSFITADPFATLFVRGGEVFAPAPQRLLIRQSVGGASGTPRSVSHCQRSGTAAVPGRGGGAVRVWVVPAC